MSQYYDDVTVVTPGKFEGESEAVRYLYGHMDECWKSASVEGRGFWCIIVRDTFTEPFLKYPLYGLHEDNAGFVWGLGFDSEEAAEAWLAAQMGGNDEG